jgi:hypothetical protein
MEEVILMLMLVPLVVVVQGRKEQGGMVVMKAPSMHGRRGAAEETAEAVMVKRLPMELREETAEIMLKGQGTDQGEQITIYLVLTALMAAAAVVVVMLPSVVLVETGLIGMRLTALAEVREVLARIALEQRAAGYMVAAVPAAIQEAAPALKVSLLLPTSRSRRRALRPHSIWVRPRPWAGT